MEAGIGNINKTKKKKHEETKKNLLTIFFKRTHTHTQRTKKQKYALK